MARAAVAVALLTTVATSALAVTLARRGSIDEATQLVALSSGALAWGGATLFAVSAAMRAVTKDEAEGIVAMVRLRGVSPRVYLMGRVGGLAAWLALLVVGGSVATATAGLAALPSRSGASQIARAAAATIAYGSLFALVLAAVALATLGTRSRLGGYGLLALALVVPDLVAPALGPLAPPALEGTLSIGAALATARSALEASPPDLGAFATSAVVLGAITAVATGALFASARRTLSRPTRGVGA